MSSTLSLPSEAPFIPPVFLLLFLLNRECALFRGDLLATLLLLTFSFVSISSQHSLTVRALDNQTHYRISGIDLGTGARLREV